MLNFPILCSLILLCALFSLGIASLLQRRIRRADAGSADMQRIAAAIRTGAMAFIRREYRVMSYVIVGMALLLAYAQTGALKWTSAAFVLGGVCSALAGVLGMRAATMANVRTTQAAHASLGAALAMAFAGGSVMGFVVVGLAVGGLLLIFWLAALQYGLDPAMLRSTVLPLLGGFSLGASTIALFARVGGGIYTKAADVGADLVGKIEQNIPEDDARNPAVIADNVGDNVGDVCGMGADLFESYAGAIVSCMVLGVAGGVTGVMLPLLLAAVGILASIVGHFAVGAPEKNPQAALNRGSFVAGGLFLAGSWFLLQRLLPTGLQFGKAVYLPSHIWTVLAGGVIVGALIGLITEYYCSANKAPVQRIVDATATGPATTVIAGLALGMRSTALPVLLLAIGIAVSYRFCGLYGIALAGLGMLATLGIQLAVDAYGPIADNAGGIAQMSNLPDHVRTRTDQLDAVGNTTAAIGKGFAIGSAALTALALFTAFREQAGLVTLDISRADVMAGVLCGAMLPFVFSSLAMQAVGRAAHTMIDEVRRQFRNIPGLMDGTGAPDYARCVDIATASALRQMIAPGLLALLAPILIGKLGKYWAGDLAALGGLLVGATVTGVMLALFMANAGGAWDNAKKSIEANAALGGKGSARHAAAVIGDTIGDPFKDTAGPALNILIKLMSILSLMLAPLL